MEIFLELLVMFVLLVFKGFFSGSEIAMVNCDKLKMRHLARQGKRGAQKVLELFETPDIILGTTLVGTNIATVGVSTLGALIFIDAFGSVGDLISVLIMTPFLLIFGEIVPKSIYQQKADTMAQFIIYPLRFFSIVFFPVIFIFSRVGRFAARLVGGKPRKEAFITREGIRTLLEMTEPSTVSHDHFDQQKISRILRFGYATAGEVMIPMADVTAIPHSASMAEAMELVWGNGYNRLPVYEGNVNNIVGIATISSWALMDPDTANRSLSEFIQSPLFIASCERLDHVLPQLQARFDQIAIVLDEFGSAMGIVTGRDIVQEVVGEMNIGHDFDNFQPHKRAVGIQEVRENATEHFVVDGRMAISQLNDIMKLSLPCGETHTVAGFVIHKAGRIPHEGEHVIAENHKFTVVKFNGRKILSIRLERL